MPLYDHECYDCNHGWEDTYSYASAPEIICPKCGGKGRRVILQVPVFKVILSGADMKNHIKEERVKIRSQLKKDENLRANLMGEEAYNNTQNNVTKIGEEILKGL